MRRAVRDGDVVAGERLPGARDLAGALGVNMHTVLRAYGDLRDEGIIELRRGRGAVVLEGAAAGAEIRTLVTQLADAARHEGIGVGELTEILKQEMS